MLSIYKHLSLHKVNNVADPSKPWCVRWRTSIMPCCAYYYYPTREDAMASWPELDGRPMRFVAASRC